MAEEKFTISNTDGNNLNNIALCKEQMALLSSNILTTDEGILSTFGDDDERKLDVRIVDTEEIKRVFLKHTVFIIESPLHTNVSISRRYNDFRWLHNVLSLEYLCTFIPPIPPSSDVNNILNKFDKGFEKNFTSQRRYDLERFLNRIFNNKMLSQSESFQLFLSQQTQLSFEEQQKSIKDKLLSRSDKDIEVFLKNKCFPELDLEDEAEDDDDDEGGIDDEKIYLEEIPRVREVYMRCNERFVVINKTVRNVYRIITNIALEINKMNEEFYGLYQIEHDERPDIMEDKLEDKVTINDFMNKWGKFQQNQMYCYYKYFVLNLKHAHLDCLAVLDIFVRYDSVYEKYKKLMNEHKKYEENVYKQDTLEMQGLKIRLDDSKALLDVVCRMILKEEIPKLWNNKMEIFNTQMKEFRKRIIQYTLREW